MQSTITRSNLTANPGFAAAGRPSPMTRPSPDDNTANLKIGAVARLTGISVHTLRKWEDRYGAVEPQRTEGGGRVYTRTDLKRLAYIKRLADAGMALREIGKLSLEELESTWEQVGEAQVSAIGAAVPDKVSIAILGDVLPALIERRGPTSGRLRLAAASDSAEALASALEAEAADILVYECPNVRPETGDEVASLLETLPVSGVIVVYGFGARSHLTALRNPSTAVMRAPVDVDELEHIARGLLYGVAAAASIPRMTDAGRINDEDIPKPRLTRETVARIALTAPRMRCECPHHLADIVLSLRAFEEYSKDCENRNEEDAELHHLLWQSAAVARAVFEDAIMRVAEVEGINLDD